MIRNRIQKKLILLNFFNKKFYSSSSSSSSSINFNNNNNDDDELFSQEFPIEENYFKNQKNQLKILENIRKRDMMEQFPQLFEKNLTIDELSIRLINLVKFLPNDFDPIWNNQSNEMKILEHIGKKPEFNFKPKRAEDILYDMNLAYFSSIKLGKLGLVGGSRSYLFLEQLQKLSRVLSRWTIKNLIEKFNFEPIITPNLLYSDFIRCCGFEPFGERTQVYSLNGNKNVCLTGTSEIPLASLNLGENFSQENILPKKYCSLSRCYRAEAKSSGEMSGLYRVHYFDKVEMFAITSQEQSNKILEEFLQIQKFLFNELELFFRIVDMPPNELGLPAYRKFDIEAYMPGRDFWGEISSTSNCTDYQTKRLNITYNKFFYDNEKNPEDISDVKKLYCHTVNGTACAIPRIILAIVEQNQQQQQNQDYIKLPKVLHQLMNCDRIEKKIEMI